MVRPQVSSLNFTSGTFTINVDAGEITHSDGSFLLGEFTNKHLPRQMDQPILINLPLSLLTPSVWGLEWWSMLPETIYFLYAPENHGDLTVNTTINVSGGDGTEGPKAGGVGVAGGFDGGLDDIDGRGLKREAKSITSGSNRTRGRWCIRWTWKRKRCNLQPDLWGCGFCHTSAGRVRWWWW